MKNILLWYWLIIIWNVNIWVCFPKFNFSTYQLFLPICLNCLISLILPKIKIHRSVYFNLKFHLILEYLNSVFRRFWAHFGVKSKLLNKDKANYARDFGKRLKFLSKCMSTVYQYEFNKNSGTPVMGNNTAAINRWKLQSINFQSICICK